MANGATLTEKLKVSWTVLVALLTLTVAIMSIVGSLSANLAVNNAALVAHQSNCDVHHTLNDLDARYMNKEFALDRWTKLELKLLRFEDKLDMLLRK